MIRNLIGFWTKEHSLSALLAVLVVQLFIFVPTAGKGMLVRLAADLALSIFLLAGLLSMAPGKLFMIPFSAFVVLGAGTHFARFLFGVQDLVGWDFTFSTLGLAGVLVITLKMVYQAGPITRHRILGAIAAHLMIAGLFGKVYAMINYLIPGAFDASHEFSRFSVEGTEDFLYFSVVALTTMGFGDITPVAPVARSFVMIEGLVGQLYPAVFIARLVSLSLAVKEGK